MTNPKRLTRRERLILAASATRGLFAGAAGELLRWTLENLNS